MGKERVAVVGIGQTKHQATRGDVSMAGLVREAAQRALDDAQMTWTDIDAVVIGKAPDFFEGVMMPELFLADALGCHRASRMFRVHTAGSVGGSTAIVASQLIQAGIHERVLTVAFEKQSESEAMWALSLPIPFTPPLHAGAGGYFAPHIRSYIRRAKAPDHIGMLVALKDRQNGLKNPYAHLHEHDITLRLHQGVDDAVGPDPLRRDLPVDRRRLRPGAGQREGGRRRRGRGPPAGVDPGHGHALGADAVGRARHRAPARWRPVRRRRLQAGGHHQPPQGRRRVEMYVPFSWFEPMWLENLGFAEPGEGWKMTEEGATALDGDLPVNMSRRRALHQPHRRLGHAPLRRGRHAGPRHRRRAPGRRRPPRRGPRLRRRLPVLRDVGRRLRQALGS